MKVANGAGAWELEIKYPEWGRYLLTATDRTGGHRAGKIVYIDWPGWAGRGQKEGGGGASILAFAADKPEYAPGETVTLTIPTPRKGRGLVSLESGSRVLRTEWIEAKGEETRYTFTATAEMAPNVYAHVTLLQPHAQTANDLPIRLYGVAPVKVVNPQTRLQPVLEVPEVLPPEATSTVSVREATGRPMAYTLAVVDEGLLGLTRYATPNPWDHFYAREALAVRTWDLYDEVVGAYGAAMERMLAVGGDEAAVSAKGRRANRFPPMVRFLGPFRLAAKATGTPQDRDPAVRGRGARDGGGRARRGLRRRREVRLRAAAADAPRHAAARAGPRRERGAARLRLRARAEGEGRGALRLHLRPARGGGRGEEDAVVRGGGRRGRRLPPEDEARPRRRHASPSRADVRDRARRARRSSSTCAARRRASTDVLGGTVKPGESWTPEDRVPRPRRHQPGDARGLARPAASTSAGGSSTCWPTRTAASSRPSPPPSRSSSSGKLLELTPEKQARVETNVKAALERLRRFQATDGGFGYWPGDDDSADWATNYAGHFAVEAQKAGYLPPPGLLDQWTSFQRRRARGWVPGEGQAELTQAYRLFTLALAGAAELPAMNQLRERASLPVAAKWRLAAAYQLAGQPEAARALVARGPVTIAPYRELGGTYGSDLRDRAMVLEAVVLLGMAEHVGPLAKSLSESLSKNAWLSTQETAYALLALSKAVSDPKGEAKTAFSFEWSGGAATAVTSASPIVERRLEVGKARPRGSWCATPARPCSTRGSSSPACLRWAARRRPRTASRSRCSTSSPTASRSTRPASTRAPTSRRW